MIRAKFSVETITDSFILIHDLDQGLSVTNDAANATVER